MPQFYFLSIVSTITVGLALAGGFLGEKLTDLSRLKDLQEQRGKLLSIGGFAMLSGLLKLIFKSPGEEVAVAGDLLPALTGIALGALLFLSSLKKKTEPLPESGEKGRSIMGFKVPLGLFGLAVAVVHFFFPGTLFL
jgi:peptidoglycan/LPS O-acetylase OafA/YrhL